MSKSKISDAIWSYKASEREAGDDVGILWYGFTWILSIVLLIGGDPAIVAWMGFYLYLDFGAALFIIFYMWRSIDKVIDKPSVTLIFKLIVYPCTALGILYLIGLILKTFLPGEIIPTNAIQYWAFEYFRLVNSEEMFFRGFVIDLFVIMGGMRERQTYKVSLKEFFATEHDNKNTKIFFMIGMVVSGILFGYLHYQAYPNAIYPLVYLSLLGIACGFLRFKYGLIAAIILHALNNIIASIFVALLFTIM